VIQPFSFGSRSPQHNWSKPPKSGTQRRGLAHLRQV